MLYEELARLTEQQRRTREPGSLIPFAIFYGNSATRVFRLQLAPNLPG